MPAVKAPHPDDAFAFIAEKLKADASGFREGNQAPYDVSLPYVVWRFLTLRGYPQNNQAEYRHDADIDEVWRAFYDAAWRLCRMGILRPGGSVSRFSTGPASIPGNGYSFTAIGLEWLKSTETLFVPSDPARYAALLARESETLGPGFAQRAREAAACHQTGNYLASCTMCGAAAESAILRAAISKAGDEDAVLKEYIKPNGRRRILESVFSGSSEIHKRFASSTSSLLFYWRDETAHGQVSEVAEIEAFHSLTTLVRLAQFLADNWDSLTKSA